MYYRKCFGKVRLYDEKLPVLGDLYFNLRFIAHFDIAFKDEILENKNTIKENSIKKAKIVKAKAGFDCFADDTGLEVEILNGAPGVFSKRFAGENASSDDIIIISDLVDSEAFSQHDYSIIISSICLSFVIGAILSALLDLCTLFFLSE